MYNRSIFPEIFFWQPSTFRREQPNLIQPRRWKIIIIIRTIIRLAVYYDVHVRYSTGRAAEGIKYFMFTLWCSPWMPKCNVMSNGELSGGCRWNNQRWMVYSIRGHSSRPKTVEHTTHDPIEKLSKKTNE